MLHFDLGAGALGDQPVMLDAPVFFEIENCAFDVVAELQVEGCGDYLVVLAKSASGDLTGGRDDRRAADQTEAVLLAAFAAARTQVPF